MRRKTTGMAGPQCELCGTNKRKLHVHHKDHNPENNDPKNLQTLCASCHKVSHSPNYTGTPPRRKPCAYCLKPVARKGLCNTHLTRLKRHGHPLGKKFKTASGWVSGLADS
jgi:hypothetical protein